LPAELVSASKIRRHSSYSALGGPANSPLVAPTSINDFQCFAINVTGPGILKDPRFSCGSIPSEVGISAGLFPVNHSQLDVMVPIGANRKIQLIGMQSTAGCPDFNTIFKNKLFDTESFGQAYVLGEVTVDVFDDTAATLVAAFDSSKIFMPACAQQEPVLPPTCPVGTNFNGSACVQQCTDGKVWDSYAKGCYCAKEQYWNGSQCAATGTVNDNAYGTVPDLTCGQDEFITGIDLRAGDIIDHYQLRCHSYIDGVLNGNLKFGPSTGGYGGNPDSFSCPGVSFLSEIAVATSMANFYGTLSRIDLTCKDSGHQIIEGNDSSTLKQFGSGNVQYTYTCTDGEFAYGIKAMNEVVIGNGYYAGPIYGILCRPLPSTQGGGGGATISGGTGSGVDPAITVTPAVPVVTP